MRPSAVAAGFLAALLGVAPCVAQGGEAAAAGTEAKLAVVQTAIEDAIRPGYAAFHTATQGAVEAIDALCETPSSANLDTARAAFGDLVRRWSRVEFIRFGPVMADNNADRILFFPDPRGIALRQIEDILRSEDATATAVDTLHDKSVAVQGLGALELVMYGPGAGTLAAGDGGFRCAYADAIAANLEAIAGDLVAGWADAGPDAITTRLTRPAAEDPAYRDADDSLNELVGVFITAFEALRDLRLTPPLGETAADAEPRLFLFNLSDHTLASLQADFAGLRTLFRESGLVGLLPEAKAFLEDSIELEFQNAAGVFDQLSPPLSQAIEGTGSRQSLTYLLIVTDSLQSQFNRQLSPALGLSAGFSSLDGD